MKRTGLAVMRCQVGPHLGHADILTQMTRECDVALLGLGSTGSDIDRNNPWSQVDRTKMIRNLFGDRVIVIPLEDLKEKDQNSSTAWVDYVLEMCAKFGHENVTDYYTGSKADAVWYTSRFYNEEMTLTDCYDDYGMYDDPQETPSGFVRQLHIIDRELNDCPSATELRTLISFRNDEWKKWIPRVNHDIIMNTYPKEFYVE